MYSPVLFDSFPGLRLLPEEAQAQGAVTMLNAEIARQLSQVSSRGGLTRLGTSTGTQLKIAGENTTSLATFRNTGTVLQPAFVSLATGVVTDQTAFGGATTRITSTQSIITLGTPFLGVASRSGAANDVLHEGGGGIVSTAGIPGSPRYISISGWDDRGVQAHFTSAAGSPTAANGTTSAVFFSAPGNFGSWGANDWIQVAPDDGDEITGMVTWRELTFVLKRRTLFVFYGTSTDSTGGAIFNSRPIALPSRSRVTTNGGGENIVAGSDGVYLLLGDGVYRTTGSTPVLVSREITPIFDGTADSTMLFPVTGDWNIGYAANRVYLTYTASGNFRTLVYDTVLAEWLLWDMSAGQAAQPTNVIEWTNANGTPTAYVASGAKVFSLTRTGTSDDGTSISSNYQYGFVPLGGGAKTRVRQSHLWGSGTPTWSVFTDYGITDALASTVTLGTSPAIAEGYDRQARRGKLFSWKVSGTSPWLLTRASLDVDERQSEGKK